MGLNEHGNAKNVREVNRTGGKVVQHGGVDGTHFERRLLCLQR